MGNQLKEKYKSIDDRVAKIIEAKPDWPCSKECDECCHQLARLPQMTKAEWKLLSEEINLLDAIERQQIRSRIKTAIEDNRDNRKHLTCPMLDTSGRICMVYRARPAACRMFGFYVSRIGNRWCSRIQKLDDEKQLDGIILGNHDSMEQVLQRMFGPAESLAKWFCKNS